MKDKTVLDEPFTPDELRLLAHLLGVAADEFGNHGCNDLPFPDSFDDAARRRLGEHFSRWNGDHEEDDRPESIYFRGGDSGAMAFFAAKIARLAEKAEESL